MAAGGMFDHLGGGFHRYSVDDRWLVPHFEKMLYDNALLAVCYLEAWQATGKEQYAAVVRQTLDYLLRDMTDPQGGFYSGEDADSEGQEGKFYLWTPAEIEAVLGPEAAGLFCRVYDVTEAGNFEGRNILNLLRPVEVEAKILGCEPAAVGGRTRRRPAEASCRPGAARPSWPRRKGAGRLERFGHRRPGQGRARRSANRATRRQPMRRPIFSAITSAAATAACCTIGARARPSTTPISTTTRLWATPC